MKNNYISNSHLRNNDKNSLKRPNWIKVKAPISFALRIADNVSAVSPDWLIAITTEFELRWLFLYLNSEAYSTLTGFFKTDSKI